MSTHSLFHLCIPVGTFCRTRKYKTTLLIAFILTILTGCNSEDSNSAGSNPVPPDLDVTIFTSSVPGAASVYCEQSFTWNNSATSETGSSKAITYSHCTHYVWDDCDSNWAQIPLIDGSNELYFYSGGASHIETVMYTDNGPPEVEYHSSDISLGMPQWPTDVTVSFSKLMDTSTINSLTFYVKNEAGSVVSSYVVVDDKYHDGAKINMTGTPGEIYTAVVTTGVTDYWGTPMSVEYTWDFEFLCGWAIYMGLSCP